MHQPFHYSIHQKESTIRSVGPWRKPEFGSQFLLTCPFPIGINRHILSWWAKSVQSPKRNAYLVGGWTNPSEKYEWNWIISPSRDRNNKYLKPPTWYIVFSFHAPIQQFRWARIPESWLSWKFKRHVDLLQYPPGNKHIWGTLEDDFPFPKVGYVIFLEVTNLKYYEHTWKALRVLDKSATMET